MAGDLVLPGKAAVDAVVAVVARSTTMGQIRGGRRGTRPGPVPSDVPP